MIERFVPKPKFDRWDDYFEPGEVLIWQGQPEPGLKAFWWLVVLSIFGIPFLVAGLFSAQEGLSFLFSFDSVWSFGMGLFLTAFSLPFLLTGVAVIFGPWLASLYGHRFIRYALTNKRAYVAKSFIKYSIATYTISPDDIITLELGRFDSVKFKTVHSHDSEGNKRAESIGFEWISNGRDVYAMIRQLQRGAT